MKKMMIDYFFVPKQGKGKIREKVFLARMTASFLFIVLCLTMLAVSAYAFFAASITSGNNKIQSAHYSLEVKVDGTVIPDSKFTCPDSATDDTYAVTITPNGSAENGYCKIVIRQGTTEQVYYTTQLFKSNGPVSLSITAAKGCTVSFVPQWGTSAEYSSNPNSAALLRNNGVIQHSETPAPQTENVVTETPETT